MDTSDRNKCCFAAISAARITINVGLNFSDSSLMPEMTNTLAFLKSNIVKWRRGFGRRSLRLKLRMRLLFKILCKLFDIRYRKACVFGNVLIR